MKKEVKQLIDEIHEEFGQASLIYFEDNPSLEKRLCLWAHT